MLCLRFLTLAAVWMVVPFPEMGDPGGGAGDDKDPSLGCVEFWGSRRYCQADGWINQGPRERPRLMMVFWASSAQSWSL